MFQFAALFMLIATFFAGENLFAQVEGIMIDTIDAGKGQKPTAVTLSATNITANSAVLRATVYPNGSLCAWGFEYGKTTSYGTVETGGTLDAGVQSRTVSYTITGLSPNTTYHFRVRAVNQFGGVNGEDKSFKTMVSDNNPPSTPSNPSPSNGATGVSTSRTFTWSCYDPDGDDVGYDLYLGTSSSNMSLYDSGQGTSCHVSGLASNQKYYWKVIAYDEDDASTDGPVWNFTTDDDVCYFPDCSSPENCGATNYSDEIYEAAQYLCELGIVQGEGDDNLHPDQNVTRAELAKMCLYSLYEGPANVPNPLVSDYFPSMYLDLQDNNSFYYRTAKALLFLEYGDGISPFDRDRANFEPENPIERALVLKVLLETFDIKPTTDLTDNPFDDFESTDVNGAFLGYAIKGYYLDIIQTNHFEPDRYCTRGEVMMYLHRILTSNSTAIPTPVNSGNPEFSDFYIPSNLSPEIANAIQGVEAGNFSYYDKDFFNIEGYMNLCFGISYNSYQVDIPNEFKPIAPLGDGGWSCSYNTYMHIISDEESNPTIVFHIEDGTMLLYEDQGNGVYSSVTDGNYNDLAKVNDNKFVLKSPDQIEYVFERYSQSDGIFYLKEIKDRNDNSIVLSYSSGVKHRHLTYVSTLGRSLTFTYVNGTDLISSVKDPLNRMVTFEYSNGQLVSVTDAMGHSTSFEYGTLDIEKGLLKEITMPKGNKIRNGYLQRKLASTQTNDGIPTTVTINSDFENGTTTSSVTKPQDNGQSTTMHYTLNRGRMTHCWDGEDIDISQSYNDNLHSELPTTVMNNKTGIATNFEYNAIGLPTKQTVVSPEGNEIIEQYAYNQFNDLVSYTDPKGNTTTYSYEDGNCISVTDALLNVTNIENNSYGSPIRVIDPVGNETVIVYNDYGNIIEVQQPDLGISEIYNYDLVSRMVSHTNALNQTEYFYFDENDLIISKKDALEEETFFNYDLNESLTSIVNAKAVPTTLTYDEEDLLVGEEFAGSSKSYTYYKNGFLKTKTLPNGETLDYTWTSSGKLLHDGISERVYNEAGSLAEIQRDGKSMTFEYDDFQRITDVSYNTQNISYEYDDNGNVTSIRYPNNLKVKYLYNNNNVCNRVRFGNDEKTAYFYYRDNGQLRQIKLPNGVQTDFDFDSASRIVEQNTKRDDGSIIVSYSFQLNALGYHTRETKLEPFINYPSDPSGSIEYTYNSRNQLLEAGNLSFEYDENGNMTEKGNNNMSYNTVNELVEISVGSSVTSFEYDGMGFRRKAVQNGIETNYVVDIQTGNTIMETDANGTPIYCYIYGPSGLLARIDAGGNVGYYISDYQGNIVAMIDEEGNITHKYQYSEFGDVIQMQEENPNPFRYAGKYGVMFETEDLYYMGARYYDPKIGRFLSEDPIWSTNLYAYSNNNPINFADPNGMWFESIKELANRFVSWTVSECEKSQAIWERKQQEALDEYANTGKLSKFKYYASATMAGWLDVWIDDDNRNALVWCAANGLGGGVGKVIGLLSSTGKEESKAPTLNEKVQEVIGEQIRDPKILTKVFGKTGVLGKFGLGEDMRYRSKVKLKNAYSTAWSFYDSSCPDALVNSYLKIRNYYNK